MSDNLKTQTISFKNLFDDNEQATYIPPEQRYDNLTTRQINATQQLEVPTTLADAQAKHKKIQKESVVKNTNIEKINPYYSYLPKFYKAEIKYERLAFILSLTIFLLVLAASLALIALFFTIWTNISPYILILLIIPNGVLAAILAITTNRYRCFLQEAKTINFRDEKVLSINVQKLYRRLKTGWIDVTWFSCLAYVLLLLGVLVDAICVAAIAQVPFGNFWAAAANKNDFTYLAVFIAFAAAFAFILVNHVVTCIMAYLRSSNIDNYYNFSVVDPQEIANIKKSKNKRDLIIFFAVTGTIIFLTWLIVRLVLNKRRQKPVTTVQI